jgi:hypothetical protein
LKTILQYPFVKVRNNEAFWAIKIRANLRIKAAKTNIYYLLTPIAIQFKDWITAMSSQFTMQKQSY